MPRIVPIGLASIAVLAGLWSGGWYYASDAVGRTLDRLVERQRAAGYALELGPVERSGYPFGLVASTGAFRVASADGRELRAAGLRVEGGIASLPGIDYRLAGPVEVKVPAGPNPIEIHAAGGVGRVRLEIALQPRPEAASLALTSVTLDDGTLPEPVRIGRVDVSADRAPAEAGASLVAEGDLAEVALPLEPVPGLGRLVETMGGAATVFGPLPYAPRAPLLAAWRDSGGRVRVDRLTLKWGALDVTATGEIALDQNLQPEGTLTAEVIGWSEVLDGLMKAGVLTQRETTVGRIGLGVLAGPPGEDGVSRLKAPLRFSEGAVYFGPLKLATLDPIIWPP